MFSKFEALDEEKKQRIVNAAMKEFAANGYDRASTNRIVEEAGIAKGLLFHYFKSKKQLFLYLYDSSIQLSVDIMLHELQQMDNDFFNRITKGQMVKLRLMRSYPNLTEFLTMAYIEDSASVKNELDERNRNALAYSSRKLFEGIDTAPFREGLDIGMVVQTVVWAIEGFANQYFMRIKHDKSYTPDYDEMFAAANEYMRFLKKCFYKEEK